MSHGTFASDGPWAPSRKVVVVRVNAVGTAYFAADVEAIIYPRLWKVMEAARDGLPDAEMRTRIEVMNRRLARVFAEE